MPLPHFVNISQMGNQWEITELQRLDMMKKRVKILREKKLKRILNENS